MNQLNTRKQDREHAYRRNLLIGFICSQLLLLAAFNADLHDTNATDVGAVKAEFLPVLHIPQTKIIKKTKPPVPVIPVVKDDDIVIDEELQIFDAGLDIETETVFEPLPVAEEKAREEVLEFVAHEDMPKLQGGLKALTKEIRYPEIAVKAGLEGRVIVQFIVDKQGNVLDPTILRGIGGGCDEEAIRVIKLMKFTPGQQRGVPVAVRMRIPITFKLK